MHADRDLQPDFDQWRHLDAIAAAGMVDDDEVAEFPPDLLVMDVLQDTATATERETVAAAFDASERFRRHMLDLARRLELTPARPALTVPPRSAPTSWWRSLSVIAAVLALVAIGFQTERFGSDSRFRLAPVDLGYMDLTSLSRGTPVLVDSVKITVSAEQRILPVRLHVTDPDTEYRYSALVLVDRAGARRDTLVMNNDVAMAASDDNVLRLDLVIPIPIPRALIIELDQHYRNLDTSRVRRHQVYVIELELP